MKEKISEKEKFFSKISHDLRGSFTSILGFSDILNDPNETLTIDEINEFSRRIQLQSGDTFNLLVNFINWLKLGHFSYGLSIENIDFYESLLETKNNLKKMFLEKNLDIKFSLEEKETVFIDSGILNSILNNLFTFLFKMSYNKSTILVNTVNSNSENMTVEISAKYDEQNLSFLQNLNLQELNEELSLPIIFANKFCELSGGIFNLSLDKNNNFVVSLQLPKEQKN